MVDIHLCFLIGNIVTCLTAIVKEKLKELGAANTGGKGGGGGLEQVVVAGIRLYDFIDDIALVTVVDDKRIS